MTYTDEIWTFRSKQNPAHSKTERLSLYWEVHGDPISDDYQPEDINAVDLLRRWADQYGNDGHDGYVRIFWFVFPVLEGAPFPPSQDGDDLENFSTFYTWPVGVGANAGERLQWTRLPVEDKLWRPGRDDKGGFLQEATGWKPGPFQDRVHVPTLLAQV